MKPLGRQELRIFRSHKSNFFIPKKRTFFPINPPRPATMATPAQLAEKARMSRPSPLSPTRVPPELPPRANTVFSPPPYSPQDASKDAEVDDMVSNAWKTRDPRRLSTDSLYPKTSRRDRRRTLLLIYIHGFMGNESSFQSFPAHVHNLLSTILRETHLVHTKIYPRYKSRKTIEFAREEFSSW